MQKKFSFKIIFTTALLAVLGILDASFVFAGDTATSVATGDTSNLRPVIIIGAAALVLVIVLLILKHKNNK